MDKLPNGWKIIKLNEIISKLGDGLHGTPNYVDVGDYYFINGNNLNNGIIQIKDGTKMVTIEEYNKYKKILDNNTVFVSINGTLGNVAFYNNEKIVLGKSVCYFNLIEAVSKYYIKYFLNSPEFIEYANNSATGSTIKNVPLKAMRDLDIPLPPLSEQILIVNKLDSLFERIDKSIALLQENIKHTEALMASVLDEVFAEMDENLFKSILDVCTIYNKTINPKDGEVYNYVGLENIESVSGRLIDFSPSTGESIKSSKVVFGNNAVLYGKLRPYLNKVWVSNFEGVSTTEILPFKPNNKILDSNYLAFFLRSPKFVNLVNSNTSGARMPRATTGFFKTIAKVPVPDLKTQEKIVVKLDAVSDKSNKLIIEQQSKLSYLKALKASLLDKAFKGEL